MSVVPFAALEGADLTDWLTEAELAVSRMHRIPGRRTAHLAGRVAVKLAVLDDARRSDRTLEARDIGVTQMMAGPQQGRPVVQLPAGIPPCDASISHSQALAVAVIATAGRVGVDIELITPRTTAFIDEVFTASEQAWLREFGIRLGRNVDDVWSLGWCIKEAMVKCTGHGLRDPLQQVNFSGWVEQEVVGMPWICDTPTSVARLVTLATPGSTAAPTTGLIALSRGYAWAILHGARSDDPQ
jgi:4'-phosphopantetheinyl transferase